MRKNMQHIFIAPPTLIIVIIILRKSANIHHTKMWIDTRPSVRSWFTTIIKSCPNKSSHEPFSVSRDLPPFFCSCCPRRKNRIIIRNITFDGIIDINTACTNSTCHFCSDDGLIGIIFSVWIDTHYIIIKTANRYYFIDAFSDITHIGSISCSATWV